MVGSVAGSVTVASGQGTCLSVEAAPPRAGPMLERAIGVIYRPRTERQVSRWPDRRRRVRPRPLHVAVTPLTAWLARTATHGLPHSRLQIHAHKRPCATPPPYLPLRLPTTVGPLLPLPTLLFTHTRCQSHYFYCELPSQFDMVIHLDETSGGPLRSGWGDNQGASWERWRGGGRW